MGVEALGTGIDILVSGITGVAGAIGTGFNQMVSGMLTTSTGALSAGGQTIFGFAAIGLAVGITTRIFLWLTSLGH